MKRGLVHQKRETLNSVNGTRCADYLFFGFAFREDFGPDSGVDILGEFEPGTRMGLIQLEAGIQAWRAMGLTVEIGD